MQIFLKNEDDSSLRSSTEIKNEEKPAQTTPTKDNRLPSSVETTNEDASKPLIHEDVLQNGLSLEKNSVDQTNSSEDTKTVALDKIPSLRISTAPLSKSGKLFQFNFYSRAIYLRQVINTAVH